MAGHESEPQFTGIQKYFNSYHLPARRNCVLATWGTIGLIAYYFVQRNKKKAPAVTEK